MSFSSEPAQLIDISPPRDTFLQDTLKGLRQEPKRLPSKYLYDERGSQLFEQICSLPEYYPTRVELEIMGKYATEMAETIGPFARLIEYGSGASIKTNMLIDALADPVACVLVDISGDHLQQAAGSLAASQPDIEVLPVCADFTRPFEVPESDLNHDRTVIYFPGSTIGNFSHAQAESLLHQMARQCGVDGGLLIGIDLVKGVDVVEAAYNDRQGVTAAFNLNLLVRINRELNADFDIDSFAHRACYNSGDHRIEMHLVSRVDQTVNVAGETIHFRRGETVCTEHSHKYTVERFADLASEAGFGLRRVWKDEDGYFAVLYFSMTRES